MKMTPAQEQKVKNWINSILEETFNAGFRQCQEISGYYLPDDLEELVDELVPDFAAYDRIAPSVPMMG